MAATARGENQRRMRLRQPTWMAKTLRRIALIGPWPRLEQGWPAWCGQAGDRRRHSGVGAALTDASNYATCCRGFC